jgi:hypothetical protein
VVVVFTEEQVCQGNDALTQRFVLAVCDLQQCMGAQLGRNAARKLQQIQDKEQQSISTEQNEDQYARLLATYFDLFSVAVVPGERVDGLQDEFLVKGADASIRGRCLQGPI